MAVRTRFVHTVLTGGGVLFVGLVLVLVGRTVQLESRQVDARSAAEVPVADTAHTRLARAVTYPTVTSRDPAGLDSAAFQQFYRYLERAFPEVHRVLDTTHVNDLSRLYTWPGTDSTAAPVVLMAHVDVVPIEAGSEEWTYPPFDGTVADGFVWGRGTLDDKTSVVGILEGVSTLLREGERPARTVHIALGHDEEVGGANGAEAIKNKLLERGPAPALVVDEGGAIANGAFPGLSRPLAAVGVAEKGYLSVELQAEAPGGHSSAPPETSSVEILNRALTQLLNAPLPARLDGVTGRTLEYVAPEMSFPRRMVLANQWLTAPVLRWSLSRDPTTDAAIRTVQVPTRLDAGVKDNIVPSEARAVVNYRILPSQSVEDVLDHVRTATETLPITLEIGQASEPTSVSEIDGEPFRILQRTIREVTADSIVVAPYLVPGATDSRHYAPVTDRVYRFLPFILTAEDRSRIHGPDERIAIEDYRRVVRFYVQLVRNSADLP